MKSKKEQREVYAVERAPGCAWQSVFPAKEAEKGQLHDSAFGAWLYILDVAADKKWAFKCKNRGLVLCAAKMTLRKMREG